jgi:hypothetical protein
MNRTLTLIQRKITNGNKESNRSGPSTSFLGSSLFDAKAANINTKVKKTMSEQYYWYSCVMKLSKTDTKRT